MKISVEEAKKHWDHKLSIDSGIAFSRFKHRYIEWTIWCETCNKPISNTVKERVQ
jgi:hypothetical protein